MSRNEDRPESICAIPEVLDSLRAGEIIIVVDDEQRENEGDLICVAEKITPELINFMATHGRGLICVAMEHSDLQRLGLMNMPKFGRGGAFNTAFMESVDARNGISTGISSADRAHTIQLLSSTESTPTDFVRPGHVFPLEAKPFGVLERPGHTEAAVDLARLAGLRPSGVICEILNEDGSMARLPDLRKFAKTHNLKITSVAALASYRRAQEKMISRGQTVELPTKHGTFQLTHYHSHIDNEDHLSLAMGNIAEDESPLVRIHSECLTGDVFNSQRCDCGDQLGEAMRLISERGSGVIVYMRQEGRGIGLAHKIQAYALQDKGMDTVEANEELGFEADLRDYGVGAQILSDLGVSKVQLLTNNPDKIRGLERHGIEVDQRIPLILPKTKHNEKYIDTKRSKLGHLL